MEKVELIKTRFGFYLVPKKQYKIDSNGSIELKHAIEVDSLSRFNEIISELARFKGHMIISSPCIIETIPKASNFDEKWKECTGT